MGLSGCASITSRPRVLCPVLGRSALAIRREKRDGETLFSGPSVPLSDTETESVKTPSAQQQECATRFRRERNCPWFLWKY